MKTIKKSMWILMVIVVSMMYGNIVMAAEDSGGSKQIDQKVVQENKPTPQEFQDLSMAMAPAFGMMAQNMMDGIYTGLAKPETAKKLAKFMRNYFDALIAEGFTKEEAIQIIKAFAIPSMGGK
jgi:hypothetical protein